MQLFKNESGQGSIFLAGGLGIALLVVEFLLKLLGFNEGQILWLEPIGLVLTALAGLWLIIHGILNRFRKKEKLQEALYTALKENLQNRPSSGDSSTPTKPTDTEELPKVPSDS